MSTFATKAQRASKRNSVLYCPIHMASEVLQPRWTIHILNEMHWGAARFNEIRRGIPGISPTKLAKRLKSLQSLGLVERVDDYTNGGIGYFRTDAAIELDLYITAEFDALVSVFFGYSNLSREIAKDRNNLFGQTALVRTIGR